MVGVEPEDRGKTKQIYSSKHAERAQGSCGISGRGILGLGFTGDNKE